VFSELCLHPWIFLQMAQIEEALVEQGTELAEEDRTSREGSTKVGWSIREPRLSSRVWIKRPCLPTTPGRFFGQLHTKPPDLCLQVV